MPKVKIRKNQSLAIPSKLGRIMGLEAGDVFEITREGDRIVLSPVRHSPDAAIDAALAEALRDIDEGRLSPTFDSMTEGIAWLESETP